MMLAQFFLVYNIIFFSIYLPILETYKNDILKKTTLKKIIAFKQKIFRCLCAMKKKTIFVSFFYLAKNKYFLHSKCHKKRQ